MAPQRSVAKYLPFPDDVTYYSAARGSLTDCSLRVEMTCPDSINVIYIETFSMNGKPMEI
jgi:hypothetical protein